MEMEMEQEPTSAGREGFRVLRMRTVASASLTQGAFEAIEDVRGEGEGPAPHLHRQSDEAFYVVEGQFAFVRGHEQIEVDAGSLIFIPRGTRHAYRAKRADSRVLILYVPAGRFDEFLRELDRLLAEGMTSASAHAALSGTYDTEPA
jgi:mannose-6-phosphate isomerase-like protein (cupin superfamily)